MYIYIVFSNSIFILAVWFGNELVENYVGEASSTDQLLLAAGLLVLNLSCAYGNNIW